ncbi:adenylate/guanylate cyclase domain-containing protein [Verrucomicrobium sp. BvORR106]|uniref:adenylate/guanylate cyclase domain-containing protein n=1 Tax=Verrucomicrobium sp. BvORR106 TaxID=1403819 RepID=UPI0022410342|nr:adenylate/guanylate cyclase domain-containing protein [Verrucomicrobium sp. BvORR106]
MSEQRRPNTLSSEATTSTQWLILPLMLAVAGILAVAYSLEATRGALDSRDRVVLDQYHREGRKTPVRDDIVILGIDDASRNLDTLWPEELEASPALQHMKKDYPYPRRVWAMLADRLFAAGAKTVFLDLTFHVPSVDPEDDRLLREAVEKYSGRLILGAKFDEYMSQGSRQVRLADPVQEVVGPGGLMKHRVGILNFFQFRDDIIRTMLPYVTSDEAEGLIVGKYPPRNPEEKPLPHVTVVVAEAVKPGSTAHLGHEVAIRFCKADAYPEVPLYTVWPDSMWEGNFGKGEFFKDKIVMVGAVAADLQDFQRTPFGNPAGVKLHAHTLTALLAGDFLQDAPWWWIVASLLVGLFVAWVLMAVVKQPLVSLLGLGLATVGAYYGCAWAFDELGREVSPLPFGLALNLCGLTGLAGNYYLKLRESRKLSRFLARYTSPELVREMMRDRAGLFTTLRGQKQMVAVLFSDVRGFTSMSESMEASAMVSQLNEYLNRMVAAVVQNRGIVDKFIGDAVMATWGLIKSDGDDENALSAVRSGLDMRRYLAELNKDWAARGIAPFHIGIGIHQAEVVAGNIGCDSPNEKMDITVIGDGVNLASRLESLTKGYGVDLVISESVCARVSGNFLLRSADLVKVVGKKVPTAVFAVLGENDMPRPSGLETYEDGVKAYRDGRFTEALGRFNQAADEGLGDTLTHVYQERCEHLIKNPPENWTGVYEMTKK